MRPDLEPIVGTGQGVLLPAPEVVMLRNNAKSGWYYRYRRQFDWDENYELYRDKVQVNRLTQRQSVNLPLMKSSVRTLLKDVDDMPVLYFENLDNDKQAELFKNEYWKWTVEKNKMDLQDIVDKRQVFLFGRSFDQWQIVDGYVKMTVIDPMDILVDRFVDPFDLHSARWLIHEHIFVPLAKLAQNKDYDQTVVTDIKSFYAGQQGIIKAKDNAITLTQKNVKMVDMGVPDMQSPILGETYVELSMHFIYRNDEPVLDANGKPTGEVYPEQIFLYVLADYMRVLMKKPLEQVIGTTKDHYWRNHFPYVTWADDVERQDFWSDSTGDIVRGSNKILNAWFSQLVENRTLRNLGMHYYNSNIEGFNPQTFQPIAFGWYGIPVPQNSNLAAVMQKVDIPDLSESLDEMEFLISINEKATATPPTQQGAVNQKKVTLGEVEYTLNEAKERIKGMSKFYTPAWQERGMMFEKMIEAASDRLDAVKIHKKGNNTNTMYTRDVAPEDWMTPQGYLVKVWSQDERNSMNLDNLNKLNMASSLFPNNRKMKEIKQRKALEFSDLKPDEINEVMQEEEKNAQAQTQQPPKESITIGYKDAPPDIQRQMEAAAGFKPSTVGTVPTAPVPGAIPGAPTATPAPAPMPQPTELPTGGKPAIAQ